MPALLIVAALLIAGLLLVLSSLHVILGYRRENSDDHLDLTVKWLGLTVYHTTVTKADLLARYSGNPLLRVQTSPEDIAPTASGDPDNVAVRDIPLVFISKRAYRAYQRFKPGIYYVIPHTRVECFEWHTLLGTAYADQTGFLAGLAWAVKSTALFFITRNSDFRTQPHISVEPCFDRPGYATDLNCIVAVSIGHIIIAGMKAIRPAKGWKTLGETPH